MSLKANVMYLQIPEVQEELLDLIHNNFVTLVSAKLHVVLFPQSS
jgi:hypothetical protein